MFNLNTEAVVVGFLEETFKKENFDVNQEVPRSQHKAFVKKLTYVKKTRKIYVCALQ